MPVQHRIPEIRIGIIQSAEKVDFQCNKNFRLTNSANQTLITGVANQTYRLTIGSATPARIEYQVRAAIEKDRTLAQRRVDELLQRGVKAQLRTVGLSFELNQRLIDNREYWIVIGGFATRDEAMAFKAAQQDAGEYVVVENILRPASGEMECNGQSLGSTVRIVPVEFDDDTQITVSNVMIGIQFHWQRYENLDYRGIIEVGFNNQGRLVVINELSLEDYLVSVNSSEMTPDCPLGLLEAQTVVARATVFATMGKHHYNTNFHLCSDDHCQCYQGKKREQAISRQAVINTWGEVIMYGDEICDARYSKICGGIMEDYANVWENRHIPYMVAGIDSDQPIEPYPANTEATARKLIDSSLPAYCNTQLYQLPPRLANLYSTQNLFRWQVVYGREELEAIIREKINDDIGELRDILPLERGASGRLIYMELVGTKKRLKVGKELEIRRLLSHSHLYSSCFYVEKEMAADGKVSKFILKGAGWGHGVGLCQVGATVMAMKQIPYQQILSHYYKDSRLVQLYPRQP
ncbi:MAG: SpoIID/LytB domain-containing protein [candidate division KSB1 bacterium]|nr:SpoIID/LytB domain-containing protein [candidate division KSB1 bacterium]MDZ7319149.1 SpoIID/LytB domain-containing protein [candidate division KSB1 bacterium]MDZ7341382.1 SpoIID/LytB domain-containing protein [candidate division KSB1 bacterium]